MKISYLAGLIAMILPFLTSEVRAQTAATYIAQGRSYLAAHDLAAANLNFSNALVLSPSDPTGNALYAITQLLVLPSQSAGSNFLTRWGVPLFGRNVYHWTAHPAKDANGVILAPAGVDANEATALFRTNILAVVIAAEANLAMVNDTNFLLALSAQEASGTSVTLDYGDIQLIRSMLQAIEYFIYNTYAWNLDAQLSVIRSFYTNQQFSIDGLLQNYPSLFTFASTNDLNKAKAAFTNGANLYLTASQYIRNRPQGVTRLFNYDARQSGKELGFRMTLADLEKSLDGLTVSSRDPSLSFFLPAQFTGLHSPRSFFPEFHDKSFVG